METVTIDKYEFVQYDGELFPMVITEEALRIAGGSRKYGDMPMVARHTINAPMLTKTGWDEREMKYRTTKNVASYTYSDKTGCYEIVFGLKAPSWARGF